MPRNLPGARSFRTGDGGMYTPGSIVITCIHMQHPPRQPAMEGAPKIDPPTMELSDGSIGALGRHPAMAARHIAALGDNSAGDTAGYGGTPDKERRAQCYRPTA
jgi:hypothetical protein